MVVGASGIVIGVLLGWWTTERITRPVERLAAGARAVAGGDLSARVEVLSRDEIGELAQAFNRMTEQLLEQRERAIQAERVAAWRELARRLAHELKNPLFPLQITIENLQRARESSEFDEVFRESTATLLAELGNLKTIIGRFSDFAKMPAPQFETVDVNEIVRGVMKLNDARFQAEDRPRCKPRLELASGGTRIQADPDQLRRALGNLVLNALDAMPEGGTLLVRTAPARWRCAPGDLRQRPGADGRGVPAPVHSLLHDQAARHRAGSGDRAKRRERSSRKDFSVERLRARDHIHHRFACCRRLIRLLRQESPREPPADRRRRSQYAGVAGSGFSTGWARSDGGGSRVAGAGAGARTIVRPDLLRCGDAG